MAELFDGRHARSQNAWPNLRFDAMAINDRRVLYYKAFMWPTAFWEKLYEPIIRRAAGLGAISTATDPDTYDKSFLHCDLLVIGAGPSGLIAALTAAHAGALVILADKNFTPGGRLSDTAKQNSEPPGPAWPRRL